MIKVFFSAEEDKQAAADGKKGKVTAYTLKAFQTYFKDYAQTYYGMKLKFKGTLSKEEQTGILNAIDAFPKGTVYEVVFKKAHPEKKKESCEFPFDIEKHKDFVDELNRRIQK
jgi:hypothetical protein